jgi:hypothetical protein
MSLLLVLVLLLLCGLANIQENLACFPLSPCTFRYSKQIKQVVGAQEESVIYPPPSNGSMYSCRGPSLDGSELSSMVN